MSECVVRMEMPNGCHDCRLMNMFGNCPIPMFDGQDEKKMWTLEECFQRPPWCPIICSIPAGHGRLGDLDAAINGLNKMKSDFSGVGKSMIEATIRFLDEAVIPIVPAEAERSEKDGR